MPTYLPSGSTLAAVRRDAANRRRQAAAEARRKADAKRKARAAARAALNSVKITQQGPQNVGLPGGESVRTVAARASLDYADERDKTKARLAARRAAAAAAAGRTGRSDTQTFRPADVRRQVQRGTLLSKAQYNTWAIERGVYRPNYARYLSYVARRRGLDRDSGVVALGDRSILEKEAARHAAEDMMAALSPVQPPRRLPTHNLGLRAGQIFEGQARVGLGDLGSVNLHPGKEGSGFWSFFTDTVPEFFGDTVPHAVEGAVESVFDFASKGPANPALLKSKEELEKGSVGLGTWASRIPVQIAEAFAYTPAFAYGVVTNPIGTAQGMIDYFKDAADDPTRFLIERPGDALMIALGAKGAVSGRVPNVIGAAARGDARGAARAAITPARSTGALQRGIPKLQDLEAARLVPGGRGRQRGRENELMARIESAEPVALIRIAKRGVVDRPQHVTRHQLETVQSEAIRSVMEQTTPEERIAFYENAAKRLNASPVTGYRLRRLIEANRIVEEFRLVEGEPGSVRIGDHPALAALADRVIGSSERGQERKIALGLLNPEQAAIRIDQPSRVFTGNKTRAGAAYSPYKVEDLSYRAVLPPRVRDRLGIPRNPGQQSFTGKGIAKGRVGNVIKLTAQEEISTLRYQHRLRAWTEAKKNSISGTELIRRIDAGEIPDIGGWAAVRMKPGTTNLPTKQLLDLFNTYEIDSARKLLDVIGEKLPHGDELRVIAREADRTGQVQFFQVGDIGLRPLEMKRPGDVVIAARTINQLAKTSVLFLAGPAYAFPNMLGQLAFSIIHKGVRQPLNDFWQAPRSLSKLDLETRLRVRAAGGSGIVQAINPAVGPLGRLRQVNRAMADFYSRFLDDWWRENAVVYEAKLRGYHTPEDLKRLVNATERGTKEHADLVDVKRAVDEHFGAFDRLTDFEKNTLTELIFFYPWLRASAVYAAKLPLNHPVKAAVLELGGSYSMDKAEQDFISLFMGHGATRKQAELAAAKLMETIPGIFLTEGGRAINPQAASLISSPFEFQQIVAPLTSGDWDAFVGNFLDAATPAVSLGVAALEGAIDRNAGPVLSRLQETVQGYSRDVTLAQRLSGDQGSWFTYTPGEAIGARLAGSGFPKGVNTENILEQTWEQYRDSLPPGRRTYVRAAEVRQKWLDLAQAHGLVDRDGGRNPEDLREAFNRSAQLGAARAVARDRLGDRGREDSGAYTVDAYRAMAREELKSLRKWGLMSDGEYRAALRKLPSMSRADLIDAHEYEARHGRLWRAYGQTFSDYRNSLKEAGVDEGLIPDPVR